MSLQAVARRQAEEEADMDRVLQQAQSNLMRNIPDLELINQEKSKASDTTNIQPDDSDTPQPPLTGLSLICV